MYSQYIDTDVYLSLILKNKFKHFLFCFDVGMVGQYKHNLF